MWGTVLCSICQVRECLNKNGSSQTKASSIQLWLYSVLKGRKMRLSIFSMQDENKIKKIISVREVCNFQAGRTVGAPSSSSRGCWHWSSACAATHFPCSHNNNTPPLILALSITRSNSRHPQHVLWGQYCSFTCLVPRLQCHSVHQS